MAFALSASNSSYGNTQTLTISDDGNYEAAGEVGHAASDFDNVYVIQVLDASGTELAVLSDLTGADAGVTKPSEGPGSGPDNSYTVSADGRYVFKILAIPTYDGAESYVYSASAPVWVYDSGDGKVYKLIQSGTGQQPSSSPTYWTVQFEVDVTDMATMLAAAPSKYQATIHSYSSYDSEALWADMIYRVHTVQGLIGDEATSLFANSEWKDTAQLFLELRALEGHLGNLNYEAIDDIFTRASALQTLYG